LGRHYDGLGALKYQSPDWTPLISCLEDLRLTESILGAQRDKKTDYLKYADFSTRKESCDPSL